MGFELALTELFPKDQLSEIMAVDKVTDGSKLGAMVSAQTLLKKGVKFLVGYPTSHEAVLAAKVCLKNSILCIFSGPGHDSLGQMGKHIVTTGEPMKLSVNETLGFIKKKQLGRNGGVIVNPYAVFSQNQADMIKTLTRTRDDLRLTYISLDKDLKIPPDQLTNITNSDFLIITPYADESAKILEALKSANIDVPIITNSSWTTGDLEFIRRYLVSWRSPIYSSTLWLKGSPESAHFERLVRKIYGREAVSEISYGYDLGVIIRALLKKLPPKYTKEDVLRAFYQQKCFDKTTSGSLCFEKTGGHAHRSIYFVEFTKLGFKRVN